MLPIPHLSDDILYMISEKLLFNGRRAPSLLTYPNAYTFFMYHSIDNMRAFVSIFSKMKRLKISGHFCCSIYRDEIDMFCPYKFEYTGPYFVKRKFVSDLLDAGLLRISILQIENFLSELSRMEKFSSTGNAYILKHLLNIRECSSNLFSPKYNLNISKLSVDESAEDIHKHLITLLSINAEHVELCCTKENLFFDSKILESVFSEKPSTPIYRTKKIITECRFDMKFTTNFLGNLMNYLQLLLLLCPNLEFMEFIFAGKTKLPFLSRFSNISHKEFVTNLELFIVSIIEHLKNLNCGCKNLKINIEVTSIFDDNIFKFIPSDHKLFYFGEAVKNE